MYRWICRKAAESDCSSYQRRHRIIIVVVISFIVLDVCTKLNKGVNYCQSFAIVHKHIQYILSHSSLILVRSVLKLKLLHSTTTPYKYMRNHHQKALASQSFNNGTRILRTMLLVVSHSMYQWQVRWPSPTYPTTKQQKQLDKRAKRDHKIIIISCNIFFVKKLDLVTPQASVLFFCPRIIIIIIITSSTRFAY